MINFIKRPSFLLILWLFFLISPSFFYVRYFLVVKNNLQTFLYISGISKILFYIPVTISIFVLCILLLLFVDFINGKRIKIYLSTFVLITLFSLVFIFFSEILLGLELYNYPNYLYSHYGILPSQLRLMTFVAGAQAVLSFVFYALGFFQITSKKFKIYKFIHIKGLELRSKNDKFLFAFVFGGLLVLLIRAGSLLFDLRLLTNNSLVNYAGRFGKDFVYIEMLLKNTPSGSVVVLPPQGMEWPAIGNLPLSRYFLFPRTLVSGAVLNNNDIAKYFGSVYFTLIPADKDRPVWPKIFFQENLISFDEKNEIKYLFFRKISDGVFEVFF